MPVLISTYMDKQPVWDYLEIAIECLLAILEVSVLGFLHFKAKLLIIGVLLFELGGERFRRDKFRYCVR